jgi:hypothetical protein
MTGMHQGLSAAPLPSRSHPPALKRGTFYFALTPQNDTAERPQNDPQNDPG